MKFSAFLAESKQPALHIEHVEDHAFQGPDGFRHAVEAIKSVNNRLQGKPSNAKISTKFDGSPAIVFGYHDGKFFVATKSAFNKKPKLMYSEGDIQREYGDRPDLAYALKASLEQLKKVTPTNNGVYQGDLMYTSRNKHEDDTHYHFTPNTLMYSVKKTDPEGQKIKNAKIGIVIHTKYHGKDFEHMQPSPNVPLGQFKKNKDVHIINPELNVDSPLRDEASQNKFIKHITEAERDIDKAHPDTFMETSLHSAQLRSYINHTVKNNEKPTAQGFKAFLTRSFEKDIDKLKTPTGKTKKQEQLIGHLSHVDEHHDKYQSLINAHHNLLQAKNVLLDSMKNKSEYETSIGGEDVSHEGYVIHLNGRTSKFVKRHEFSKANFANHDKNKKAA